MVNALVGTGAGRQLRKQLGAAAVAYLAGDGAALDPAWFDHAFDLYLYDRDGAAVRTLVDKALASEDPVFRPAALGAAARTGFPAMAAWLLSLDDPRLRESERRDLLDGIMARSASREYGYGWALSHVGALLGGADGQAVSTRLPQMLGRFCSVAWADRIARDFKAAFAATPGRSNWTARSSGCAIAGCSTT
ncbi:hypothetical protein ACFSLT_08755 [Novosphingobium resinovorum]